MKALILDTETTALISNHSIKLDRQPEVIEFFGALTDLTTGIRIGEYEQLIKPRHAITNEITEITGITNEMVAKSPCFSNVADAIRMRIEAAPVVIAHNMSFDKEVIDIEFERFGQKIKWPRVICTVEATLHFKGFRLSLSKLYDHLFSDTFKDAHRARSDTTALERCCIELYKRGVL